MLDPKNIVVIGTGAIGTAFIEKLGIAYPQASLHIFSQSRGNINYNDESSIESAASSITEPLDLVIVATGILHGDGLQPEKSLREVSADNLQRLFIANSILPILCAKHFLPRLNRDAVSIFAVLSARVGSISDNSIGGWYSYRASKSALNMLLRNASIEIGRRNSNAIVVGVHPGTVDSDLSKPFQGNVADGKLFTADYSATRLLDVLGGLSISDSGKCFAWDGTEILP